MKTYPSKLKILAVGPEQKNITTKQTTRKVMLSVSEIPSDNPFGHNHPGSAAFDVEVYNHNIENFNIGPSLIGEIADCELEIKHYKTGDGPAVPKFIINDLSFRL